MSSLHFASLKDETNPELVFRLKVEWFDRSFHIVMLSHKNAYDGTMSEEYIINQSKLLNMPQERYMDECKSALRSDSSETNFFYCVDDEEHFCIKKQFTTPGQTYMKIKFGSIKLQKVDLLESVNQIFDSALSQHERMSRDIENLRMQTEISHRDYMYATDRLRKTNETKQFVEQTLYFRFLNLLNSKKQQISALRDKLEAKEFDEGADLPTASHNDSCLSDIFDVETDVDDGEEIECKPSKCSILSPDNMVSADMKQKTTTSITSAKQADESEVETVSKIETIMNSMSFLDPSVRFSP